MSESGMLDVDEAALQAQAAERRARLEITAYPSMAYHARRVKVSRSLSLPFSSGYSRKPFSREYIRYMHSQLSKFSP